MYKKARAYNLLYKGFYNRNYFSKARVHTYAQSNFYKNNLGVFSSKLHSTRYNARKYMAIATLKPGAKNSYFKIRKPRLSKLKTIFFKRYLGLGPRYAGLIFKLYSCNSLFRHVLAGGVKSHAAVQLYENLLLSKMTSRIRNSFAAGVSAQLRAQMGARTRAGTGYSNYDKLHLLSKEHSLATSRSPLSTKKYTPAPSAVTAALQAQVFEKSALSDYLLMSHYDTLRSKFMRLCSLHNTNQKVAGVPKSNFLGSADLFKQRQLVFLKKLTVERSYANAVYTPQSPSSQQLAKSNIKRESTSRESLSDVIYNPARSNSYMFAKGTFPYKRDEFLSYVRSIGRNKKKVSIMPPLFKQNRKNNSYKRSPLSFFRTNAYQDVTYN